MSNTSAPASQPIAGAVDVNVHLSRWHFRRLPLDETAKLVDRLRALGTASAWCGSFDAVLHRDMAAVNARLVEACADAAAGGILVPFGCVNPMLPDWEEDLRRCHEQFHMPGIRLYPNYHGYKLDAPAFARLFQLATDRKLIVQIAVSMEDERSHHPLMLVPRVDVAPLQAALDAVPAARVVLLNALTGPRGGAVATLAKAEQVSFDIATLESVGGVGVVLERLPAERLLYGSNAPFFYPESSAMKMNESPLKDDVVRKLLSENAARLLKRA